MDPTFNLVDKDGARGVDPQEVHRDLSSGQKFVDWAKPNLEDFVKGRA